MAEKGEVKARRRGPGRPFVKGQVANPGGRPKLPPEVKALCRDLTPEMVEILAEIARKGKTDSARVQAAENIVARAYGRPTQPIAGDDELPAIRWKDITAAGLDALAALDPASGEKGEK